MALERRQAVTVEEYLLVSSQSMEMELYRKEQNKWIYTAFGDRGEIHLACLNVHFPVIEAYEGINPKEDFPPREENNTFLEP